MDKSAHINTQNYGAYSEGTIKLMNINSALCVQHQLSETLEGRISRANVALNAHDIKDVDTSMS